MTPLKMKSAVTNIVTSLIVEQALVLVPRSVGAVDRSVIDTYILELPYWKPAEGSYLGMMIDRAVYLHQAHQISLENLSEALLNDEQTRQMIGRVSERLGKIAQVSMELLRDQVAPIVDRLTSAIEGQIETHDDLALEAASVVVNDWGVLNQGHAFGVITTLCSQIANTLHDTTIPRETHVPACFHACAKFPVVACSDLETLGLEKSSELYSLLNSSFRSNAFVSHIAQNVDNAAQIYETTMQLSELYNKLYDLKADDASYSAELKTNIDNLFTRVCLMLGGIYILRQTKFKNAFVMGLNPTVINNDLWDRDTKSVESVVIDTQYLSHHEIPLPRSGWNLAFIEQQSPAAHQWHQTDLARKETDSRLHDQRILRRAVEKTMQSWAMESYHLERVSDIPVTTKVNIDAITRQSGQGRTAIADLITDFILSTYQNKSLLELRQSLSVAYESLHETKETTVTQQTRDVLMKYLTQTLMQTSV